MASTSNLSTASCSSCSASSQHSWDVFLSFRGEDTRCNFTSHLYSALVREGIRTFRDDPALQKGQEISTGILKAIKESKMFVVVISENYARSRWCLEELVMILSCNQTKSQVVPVFYKVDPSHVRHQKGSFALDDHKQHYADEIINKWKSALAEIAELSGYHLRKDPTSNESNTVKEIVENVALQVSTKVLDLDMESKEFQRMWTGVKDGTEWLKDELGYLLIAVRAAEKHQDKDHIRLWTNSVKDVSNQADIILERFSAQQEEHASPEQAGVLDRQRKFGCICKKEANLYDIGKDIESLKEKVVRLKINRDEYRINDMIIATPNVQQRKRILLRATSFDHEDDVVGFEDDIRTLLAQLGNEDPSLGLISIHGMGGLGKSTLASKLYHSNELSHFRSRAWVCVSEDYDITHVLRKIIKCFKEDGQDSLNKMEEVELLRYLRKILLDGDHYLVVIDDIWDVNVWKKIKKAFPDKNGSRVIITTRNKKVAEGVDYRCFVHELRFLTEDESWQLFCKRAKPTPNLEMLGKEMVDKCGGLPLAIVILSGLLLQKKTYKFWSDMRDQLWRKLKGESSEIQELLNLSYDDLSFNISQCFLYLARYPEDHTIKVFELKLLWIAEEFVDEQDGVDMEDVAEDYVNELINRNMIQIELQTPDGQVLECKIHDLVRDLVIEKAREQKILGIFDSSKQYPHPIRLLQGQARHAIYKGIGEYFKLLGPNSDHLNLRSLAVTIDTGKLKIEEIKLMFTRFRYLKVLDLTSLMDSEGIPEAIGNLVLLKFLGLMGGNEKVLVIPPSIGKLKMLQTLKGPDNFNTRYAFPKEMCELKELRHLIVYGIQGNWNIGSDQTKLQTINRIYYKEWRHIDTINWTNLHTLAIGMYEDDEDHSLESIANLTSLRTLEVVTGRQCFSLQPLSSCKHLNKVVLLGEIEDPAELSYLPHSVTDLTIMHNRFKEDPMPILGCLSNLTSLWLNSYIHSSVKMVFSADVFQCLQFLKIGSTQGPRKLQVEDGALPAIRAFSCTFNGVEIPLRLRSLPPVPKFCTQYYL